MSDAQPTAAVRPDSVLFSEPGARWRTVAYGPLLCLLVLILELALRRGPVHWFGLAFCAILLAGFVTLQVVAGKRHVSVELTDSVLREGTETLPLESIARVFPELDEESWDDEPWEAARALGELTGVPRRRRGIGLKLRDGAMVQAWARDHQQLRAELSAALDRLAQESAPAAKKSAAADSPAKESAVLAASADDAENSVVAFDADSEGAVASEGKIGSEGREDVA
ncbi:hypothetical protein [Nocardia cerradoensis]|uniref:hypothetical protein n=1 Tax=Nocardia cerradoensis TaxID=85688 RepID=UPI00030574D6|nr:hypothetical protein [Nocardia cerradoensis]